MVWQGRLYFAANDMQHGAELWSSDGTAAGTRLEFDLFPGPRWSWPGDLRVGGDRLYFAAQDESHGRELWVLEEGSRGGQAKRDIAPTSTTTTTWTASNFGRSGGSGG